MSGTAAVVGQRMARAALVDLVHRSAGSTSSVLVVVSRASAAQTWRTEVLRRSPEQSGFVRVTTPLAFAIALLRSRDPDLDLVSGSRQRAVVAELLHSDADHGRAPSLWPTQHRYLRGPAFLDEIVGEVRRRVHRSTLPAEAAGRPSELASFLVRYESELVARNLVDGPMALHTAQALLRTGDRVAAGLDPSGCVVVEHQESFNDAARPLVQAIIERAERRGVRVARSQARLSPPVVPPDDRCELLRIHHPAVQADAIVSVVRRWIDAGRGVDRLAVVFPQADSVLQSELSCAALRARVPLVVGGSRLGDSPIVQDCARAITEHVAGPGSDDLGERAYAWWLCHASSLLSDRRAVDLVTAFIRALTTGVGVADALDRRSPPAIDHGIAVISLDDAIDRPSDEPWEGVVLVGCVEGTFPRRRTRSRWFADDTNRASTTADLGPNREDALVAYDRQRLVGLLDAVATDGEVVAIAAPLGGVLPSPFVDGWRRAELSLLRSTAPIPPRPTEETAGETPLFPTGALRLSATQLTTFEDCSWRYAFEYGLGLRGAGGAPASAGSFVHAVLEAFLATPATDAVERSRTRLFELLDELWDQNDFPYAAQSFDYRRRAEQWLGNWWEFFCDTSPDVRLTEHRFEVPFPAGEQPTDPRSDRVARHTLVGSIDRVDVIADDSATGSAVGVRRTRIVDYKSGSPKSAADVADDLQLAIYHYAATHDPVVRELGRPDRLELHYLQDDASKERVKVLSRPVTEDLEAQTVTRIEALAAAILREDYAPNPDANCDYCAFHTLCPTKQQGRNVR